MRDAFAPIQVNYFGYSGTMGVGYIDYLIGDKTIIPQNQRKFYSENIVYLPNSFLPPDHKRQHIRQKIFTRGSWPAGQWLRLLLLQQSLQDLARRF